MRKLAFFLFWSCDLNDWHLFRAASLAAVRRPTSRVNRPPVKALLRDSDSGFSSACFFRIGFIFFIVTTDFQMKSPPNRQSRRHFSVKIPRRLRFLTSLKMRYLRLARFLKFRWFHTFLLESSQPPHQLRCDQTQSPSSRPKSNRHRKLYRPPKHRSNCPKMVFVPIPSFFYI